MDATTSISKRLADNLAVMIRSNQEGAYTNRPKYDTFAAQ